MKARLATWIVDAVRRAPRALNEPIALMAALLLMSSYERKLTLENIARVFPEWSAWRRWKTAFAAYHQMARTLVEFLHTPEYDDSEILDRVHVHNEEPVREAHALGRGVVMVTGHFGNWEWVGRRMAAAGYPFAALYRQPKNAGFGSRLKALREAAGLVQIESDDMRSAYQWLRRGGILGIIMDQEPRRSGDGAMAPLFGHPASTHVGPFRLARLTGSPVFTLFCHRIGPGRYEGTVERFRLSDQPDEDEAVAEDAREFNERLEAAVRAHPDHWLWMYKRWGRLKRRQREGHEFGATAR